jgi:hypothetical protein
MDAAGEGGARHVSALVHALSAAAAAGGARAWEGEGGNGARAHSHAQACSLPPLGPGLRPSLSMSRLAELAPPPGASPGVSGAAAAAAAAAAMVAALRPAPAPAPPPGWQRLSSASSIGRLDGGGAAGGGGGASGPGTARGSASSIAHVEATRGARAARGGGAAGEERRASDKSSSGQERGSAAGGSDDSAPAGASPTRGIARTASDASSLASVRTGARVGEGSATASTLSRMLVGTGSSRSADSKPRRTPALKRCPQRSLVLHGSNLASTHCSILRWLLLARAPLTHAWQRSFLFFFLSFTAQPQVGSLTSLFRADQLVLGAGLSRGGSFVLGSTAAGGGDGEAGSRRGASGLVRRALRYALGTSVAIFLVGFVAFVEDKTKEDSNTAGDETRPLAAIGSRRGEARSCWAWGLPCSELRGRARAVC